MRKDSINAIIIFFVVLLAGLGLMYANGSLSSIPQTKSATSSQKQTTTNTSQKLQITDENVGDGTEAKDGDSVTVNYVGTLTNGTKFDSSYDRNQPFTFTLGKGEVIKGWDQGVAGMKVGGKRKLVIPPSLGYGDQQQGSIPPNSTLVFEVELLDVK